MIRDSFVFYRSYWEEILELGDEEEQHLFLEAVLRYVFNSVEPQLRRGPERALWKSLKFRIDSDYKKWQEKAKEKKNQKKKEEKENVNVNVNENENYFFKEKKEKFCEEVFSFTDYPRHHLQTFVDYYAQPLQSQPHKMLYEKYDTWNLTAALAKWKAPAEPVATKSKMILKSAEQRAADRRAETEEQRQRILGIVEEWRKNPDSPRAFLVREWEKNGTLTRMGIDINSSP